MPRLSPQTPTTGWGTHPNDFNLAPLFAEETAKPSQSKLFHLVTLNPPDPELPLNLVDSNYDVKFDNQTYTRFPLKWNPAEMNSDGSISKSSITIANVSREIMYYVEKYKGLRTCRVFVKTVYENVLDEIYYPQSDGTVFTADNPKKNNTAYIEDEFYIDNYTANEQTVTFQLEPIIDLEIRLPRRRYMQDSCYWIYRDVMTCGHAFDEDYYLATYPDVAASVASKAIPSGLIHYRLSGAKEGRSYRVLPDSEFTSCGKTLADCRARNNQRNFGGFPGISSSRRIYL